MDNKILAIKNAILGRARVIKQEFYGSYLIVLVTITRASVLAERETFKKHLAYSNITSELIYE